MNLFEKFYDNSPVFIQNLMVSAYGYQLNKKKYTGVFSSKLEEFKRREIFTKQQFRDYQTTELRKLLKHAFNTVPYYNETYKKHGFNNSIFSKFEIEDLIKLPFLEKETLRKYGTTTLLSKEKKKGNFISTSGSTGTPIKIFYSQAFFQIWSALYEARVRNWAGIDLKMKRGMIGGRKILPDAVSTPPFYRYNLAEKQTYFSAYHISKKNLNNYIKGIINNDVEYMVGYAMSNYFLADLIVKNNCKVPKLKAVLTSSEKLTKEMRETFMKAYNCRTFDAYSGVESCGLISENMDGDFLWSSDVAIAEVIDENYNYTLDGELISTGLLNFDQPLIRYRIGDFIKVSENQETKSGSEMLKIDEVSGRLEDAITTEDGRKIISLYRLFSDVPYLKLSQVIQNSFTCYQINIVVESSFSEKEEEIIRQRFYEKIGTNVTLSIKKVNTITKEKNGKYKLTISKIKNA